MGADALDTAVASNAAARSAVGAADADPLTGLASRAAALAGIATVLATPGADFALLCIDLDGFARVNDSLGRAAGDEVLGVIGRRLRNSVRAGNIVARLEQDVFLVLVDGIRRPVEAQQVAERLRSALNEPVAVDGDLVRVGASVGIALSGARTTTAESLVRDALAAVRTAKQRSDLIDRIDRSPKDRADRRPALADDLRPDQLWTAYQPQLDLRTSRQVGVEAALRWTHPVRGPIGPAEFMAAADGLAEFGLRQACTEIAALELDLELGVNLSARQFDDPRLVSTVAQILDNSGLPRRALCLEITETTLLRDPAIATRRLNALRDLGIRVAIDDFGTGYAALGHLRRLPIDVLKIDKSFIAGLRESDESEVTVASIVALAHAMGLTVTADGVESADQLDIVRELGCDRAQGFHIGRPVPADELRP